jgi:hypothetical protein
MVDFAPTSVISQVNAFDWTASVDGQPTATASILE